MIHFHPVALNTFQEIFHDKGLTLTVLLCNLPFLTFYLDGICFISLAVS